MRVVVLGGRGLIGDRVVSLLRRTSHNVVGASRRTGVDVVTGHGLDDALRSADVIVDVTDTRAIDERAIAFFETATTNVIAASARHGVRHHIALSIVGVDRVQDSAYFRAKALQEALIAASATPHTIVRSTQFFDLIARIVDEGIEGEDVVLPRAMLQPIDSDDVAQTIADIAAAPALNGAIEVAGPEQICLNELARLILSAREDPRRVVVTPDARYFGAKLSQETLLPSATARLGSGALSDWLRQRISAD